MLASEGGHFALDQRDGVLDALLGTEFRAKLLGAAAHRRVRRGDGDGLGQRLR